MYLGVFNTDERLVLKKTPIWNCDKEFKKNKTVNQAG